VVVGATRHLPPPIILLGLGFLLGERGLNFISVAPDDTLLETVGLLTLAEPR
jgi:hypothetical protein